MKVKSYDEFVNEEISRKGIIGAMGGAMLGLGAIGTGTAYQNLQNLQNLHQINSETHKTI